MLELYNIDFKSVVYKSFFVSDLVNQAEVLEENCFSSHRHCEDICAVSYIEQPPLPDNKVVLWIYHNTDKSGVQEKENSVADLILSRNGYKHVWNTGLTEHRCENAYQQTVTIFENYTSNLTKLNM